jgi:hypothetical protein
MFGSIRLSAIQRSPSAVAVCCSASSTPRLCASARVTASMMVSVIGSAVAGPEGTPPANGLVRGSAGACASAGAAVNSATARMTSGR